MSIVVEKEIAGRVIKLETGKIAKLARGAVVATCGGTTVLAAVSDGPPRSKDLSFRPMTVDYREMGYAAGILFGGRFHKREGRPTEKEILTMRMIDRPVRPLFPDGYKNDLLISSIVLSSDSENAPEILAIIASSAALAVSPLPFHGPLGAVRIGRCGDELVVNPTGAQMVESSLDLVVAGKKGAIAMVEAGAKEVSEDIIVQSLELAQQHIDMIVEMQEELAAKVGVVKEEYPDPDLGPVEELTSRYHQKILEAVQVPSKKERSAAVSALVDEAVTETCNPDDAEAPSEQQVRSILDLIEKRAVRGLIGEGKRIDGRPLDAVRDISAEVRFLPEVHGSALFTRGETQSICTTTLGTKSDEQLVETLVGEYSMRFLLHYNFPSFCVGEARPPRGPSRRDIGHGSLARRALEPVLPDVDTFPYTIRVVSDIMESNGSSSMASVCGGTLSLMDAGVPIRDPVAGVAMGLVKEGDDFHILTDILGDEDHYGDMDFKVAGTQHGITALQMDIKIEGISSDVMRRALEKAHEARIHILRHMLTVLERPRSELPKSAPKLRIINIPPESIGKLIGPGGSTINGLQERTGTKISVDDDGRVFVASQSQEAVDTTCEEIELMFAVPEVGKSYDGRVTAVKDFGAFVEIFPGREGLVHISELTHGRVNRVEDVLNVGDSVQVKLISIDDRGRLRLSRRALLEEREPGE